MRRPGLFVLLMWFVLHTACHTPAEATGGSAVPLKEHTAKTRASIISVILNARSDGKDVIFELGMVSVKDGTFKHINTNHEPSWYKASFTDKTGKILDSSFFENPLAARMESVDDKGKLVTGTNIKKESAVYIRAKYNSSITHLHIYDSRNKKINTFDIQTHLK